MEDAPNGILSAYRAGMKVVMVLDLSEPDEELREMVTCVISNLRELVSGTRSNREV